MIKTHIDKLFPITIIIMIITIIGYYFWTVFGLIESKYLIISLIVIAFFRISFAGILASIKDAKSIKKKFIAGLIGNVILNTLFLIALFYVILTMNN